MKLLYDAAAVEGRKFIDVSFGYGKSIFFALRSEHINSMFDIDLYGENFTGFGLGLSLNNDKYRGHWIFNKLPSKIWAEMDNLNCERTKTGLAYDNVLDDILKRAKMYTQRIPATLQELQDVAGFIERSRDRAELA